MSKIIFLDIDGVLNWEESKSRCGLYLGIDTVRVKRLARIIEATGAKIVLTSTWKENFEIGAYRQSNPVGKYLNNKLRKQGLTIYDKIPDMPWSNRADGIMQWLNQHKEVTGYAILDDQWFNKYGNVIILNHLVKTVDNFDEKSSGLTDDLVEKTIKILNNEITGPVLDEDLRNFCKDYK